MDATIDFTQNGPGNDETMNAKTGLVEALEATAAAAAAPAAGAGPAIADQSGDVHLDGDAAATMAAASGLEHLGAVDAAQAEDPVATVSFSVSPDPEPMAETAQPETVSVAAAAPAPTFVSIEAADDSGITMQPDDVPVSTVEPVQAAPVSRMMRAAPAAQSDETGDGTNPGGTGATGGTTGDGTKPSGDGTGDGTGTTGTGTGDGTDPGNTGTIGGTTGDGTDPGTGPVAPEHPVNGIVTVPTGCTILRVVKQGQYGHIEQHNGKWIYVLDKPIDSGAEDGRNLSPDADLVYVLVEDKFHNRLRTKIHIEIQDDIPDLEIRGAESVTGGTPVEGNLHWSWGADAKDYTDAEGNPKVVKEFTLPFPERKPRALARGGSSGAE